MPMFLSKLQVLFRGEKDIEFLQLIPKDKIADFIPHTQETTTVDLLIGSDYFWDIVDGGKKVCLCYPQNLVTLCDVIVIH